jgi:transposase
MMGIHEGQKELFTYGVNLDRRVRADHPLRAICSTIDFGFVRAEVAGCHGRNGNESVDPVVIIKLMFVLFFDNVKSERELMRMLPERLDYLWFLGFVCLRWTFTSQFHR